MLRTLHYAALVTVLVISAWVMWDRFHPYYEPPNPPVHIVLTPAPIAPKTPITVNPPVAAPVVPMNPPDLRRHHHRAHRVTHHHVHHRSIYRHHAAHRSHRVRLWPTWSSQRQENAFMAHANAVS